MLTLRFKLFVDPICRGSIRDVTVAGKPTSSVQYEEPVWGGKKGFIAKITNMHIPFDEVDKTLICMRISGTCNTLQQLTAPVNKGIEALEFALYDPKVDDYECCPMFIVPTNPW